ncbi:MAG: GNAT family N-acetyltransferase, partial [Acidobacteriaceae bacterium]
MELFTPRLRLREFIQADFSALRDMDAQLILHTYERMPPTELETHMTLEESLKHQTDNPRTVYKLAMVITPQDSVKGLIKLSRQWSAIREWEIGWAVHPQEWGKGFATEAAWCVMDYAFRELGVHRIVAFCHVDNR